MPPEAIHCILLVPQDKTIADNFCSICKQQVMLCRAGFDAATAAGKCGHTLLTFLQDGGDSRALATWSRTS